MPLFKYLLAKFIVNLFLIFERCIGLVDIFNKKKQFDKSEERNETLLIFRCFSKVVVVSQIRFHPRERKLL